MNIIAPKEQLPSNVELHGRKPVEHFGFNQISRRDVPNQPTDLLGPLVRRKYVIILFSLFGLALGYLAYQQATPIYQSTSRLMIWSQAPPIALGEDPLSQQISLAKYENLLGSRVVLGRAIEDADLQNTETIAMAGTEAVSKLQSILAISSSAGDRNTDDSITMSVRGPSADELPGILSNITTSFIKEIEGNTKEAGSDSLELIKKLEQRLLDEKEIKEKRHLELLKKIGLVERDENGDVINPFTSQLQMVEDEMLASVQSLRDIESRLALLQLAVESGNEEAIRVCAIEGREFLQIESVGKTLLGGVSRSNTAQTNLAVNQQNLKQLTILESEGKAIDGRLMDLAELIDQKSAKLGPQHIDMRLLYQSRERWLLMKKQVNERIEELLIDEQPLDFETRAKVDMQNRLAEWNGFRQKEESEWLSLYQVALVREKSKLTASIEDLDQKIAKISASATSMAQDVDEVNSLKSQIEDSRSQVRAILESLPKLDVLFSNYNNVRVRVVDPPQLGVQVAPLLIKYLGIGLFLSAAFGCGLALLIDRADHSFRSPNEIVEIFRCPVIGRVPRIRANKTSDSEIANTLVVAHSPSSSVAESMRAIRTAIFFNSSNVNSKLLLFTSPSPGDGKSTTICNLAISIAQAGKRVCLVDCDFRRPRVHRYFGVKAKPGAKAYIQGDVTLMEAIQPSGIENLSLLTCGGHPDNPGEFILQPQFADMFEQLREEFDLVLIDSPPVIPVSDPTVLAAYVDAIYMVLRIRKGVTVSAQQTVDTLSQVEARIHGVIVNGVDQNPYYNEYNYNYGYQMLGGYYYNKYGGGRYYERYNEHYGDDEATKRRIAAEPNHPNQKR